MDQFGLQDHAWFRQMFEIRACWIPAFFSDMPMGGLLRTTSRSESQNIVFGSCISQHSSLVEFFIRFEGVHETQRFAAAKLEAVCEGNAPALKTPLVIKRYVAALYTISIFHEVQKEIFAGCFSCRVNSPSVEGVFNHFVIEDEDGRVFNVNIHTPDKTTECSCRMFQQVGLVCRHMFIVFQYIRLECIPVGHVVSRWIRDAHKHPIYDMEGCDMEVVHKGNSTGPTLRQAWNEFYSCIGLAGGRADYMCNLVAILREHKEALINNDPSLSLVCTKSGVIESLCGTLSSSTIAVRAPTVARNKGSGKRLKSSKEIAIEKASKAKRKCKACNQLAHHDSRNCPFS